MTITLTREEAQQVLDVIEKNSVGTPRREASDLLRARLAQPELEQLGEIVPADEEQLKRIAKLVQPEPEPEHVATIGNWGKVMWREGVYPQFNDKLYSAPPQREWQGLTDEEIKKEQHHIDWTNVHTYAKFARAIEAKLKAKNAA